MVRIRDVASAAGLSASTVSRALNGDPTVRREYRDRIVAAATSLGYRPNRLAQNLRRQRSAAIGVVVSNIENPHFSQMVRTVEAVAFRHGHRVLICDTDDQLAKQQVYLRVLADERVLGVILAPTDPADVEVSNLLDTDVPVVAFDLPVDDPRADAVVADNVAGVRLATATLLDLGHRRIAFIGGRPGVGTEVERRRGFDEAMRDALLEPWVIEADFRMDGGRQAMAELLAAPMPPTAVVVANNLMTIGALEAAHAAGIVIPDQVALVSVDDPIWAHLTAPTLTTVAQPVRAMAASAMELLLGRIDGDRSPSRLVVHPFELRLRGSSGEALAAGTEAVRPTRATRPPTSPSRGPRSGAFRAPG